MGWVIGAVGYPTCTEFISRPAEPMDELPRSMWRITEGVNDGYPWFDLLPDYPAPPHVDVEPVKQREYICIYDLSAEKSDFLRNGLAILHPSRCMVYEQLNGQWYVDMEHPIDSSGKHTYIRERNILKVMGQLFTIMEADENYTSANTGTVRVKAEHIFYQLNDPWIFPLPKELRLEFTDCNTVIRFAKQNLYYHAEAESRFYEFESNSEWVFSSASAPYIFPTGRGMTLVEVLIGDGGITDSKGGELYRDNFYYSLNERMENAKDNAFDIRVGLNLCGIRRTVDVTTFCSYFRGYDNYGSWWAVSWLPTDFMMQNFPHHIVRSKNYYYEEYSMEKLIQDGMADFRKNFMPLISYEFNLADLRNNPDFEELLADFEYKVGNSGRLYDVRFGSPVTLKITATETDAIHERVTKVTVGTLKSFTRTSAYPAIDVIQPQEEGGMVMVRDSDGVFCYDADGVQIVESYTV